MIRLYKILLILSVLVFAGGCSAASALDVVMLGDSNTWIGGDDCSKPRGWNYWFARKDSTLNCRSYARSGATWTATRLSKPDTKGYTEVLGDNNIIYNQLLRVNEDVKNVRAGMPDMVIIMAGTNDAWFQKRRPDIFSKTVEQALKISDEELLKMSASDFPSLASQIRMVVGLLRHDYPNTRIVLVTPMPSTATSAESLLRVSDVIYEMAEGLNLECIRLDTPPPFRADAEKQQKHFTTDGTHTSEEGARLIADIIYSKLFSK